MLSDPDDDAGELLRRSVSEEAEWSVGLSIAPLRWLVQAAAT